MDFAKIYYMHIILGFCAFLLFFIYLLNVTNGTTSGWNLIVLISAPAFVLYVWFVIYAWKSGAAIERCCGDKKGRGSSTDTIETIFQFSHC